MTGYSEFELDIPEVMRHELPKHFDELSSEPLTRGAIAKIPPKAQGAYMLFLEDKLVYIGKTDAQAGFRNRLIRHYHNLQHRKNLDPDNVSFKAVRVFVFSNFDLEAMLIEEYAKRGGRPAWNYSGFGSNDPGRNRESQKAAKFDLDYPVDIDRKIDFLSGGERNLVDVVVALKEGLPYLFRYDTDGLDYRQGHPEMKKLKVTLADSELTTRRVLNVVLNSLSPDWQATVLPNRVILYKEDQHYAQQIERLKRMP